MRNIFRRKRTPQQIGIEAERLLNDPVYAESTEALESIVIDALKGARIETVEDEKRVVLLVLRLQAIEGSKRLLDQQISYGKLAAKQELARETNTRGQKGSRT